MAGEFFTILTNTGKAKLATAIATGVPIDLTQIAVGNGLADAAYTPTESQLTLKGEQYRAAMNALLTDPENPGYVIAELVIPASVGGWTIREAGVFDAAGDMIAVGKFPDTYKPVLESGSAKDIYLKFVFEVTNSAAVTLAVDPSLVLATHDYVAAEIADHLANDDATEAAEGHVRFATAAETLAGLLTSKAVHPAGVKAVVDALLDGTPGALDTLNELAAALGDDANYAATMITALAGKAAIGGSNAQLFKVLAAIASDEATTLAQVQGLIAATETETTLTDQATVTWDWATQGNAKLTLGGNRTLAAPSGLSAGKYAAVRIVQDVTGGRVLSFASNYKGLVDAYFSTGAGEVDWLLFRAIDATNCELVGFRGAVGV